MTSVNSGAVFFLGTRAHYQVLTAPDQQYDLENGNSSTDTLYESNGNDTVIDIDDTREFDFGSGVKRRLRKNRKQDGSSELILNDNDAFQDYEPSDLNTIDDSDTPKLKFKSRARITVSHIMSLLTPRRVAGWGDGGGGCSYRDSCRCLDCQSRYFECDESEDEYNYSVSEDDSWSVEEPEYDVEHRAMETDDQVDDDDEVFLSPSQQPETTSTTDLIPSPSPFPSPAPRIPRALGLAAGAPALCDHLLSHPVACVIQ